MKVKIELPRDWEVSEITHAEDGQSIVLTPRFTRGSRMAPVAYLTATGDKGREERALLNVSATTGRFGIINVAEATEAAAFDQDDKPQDDPDEGQ